MTVKYKGELLTKEELKEIAENFVVSQHAAERITERYPELDIAKAILNPLLAYFNTDGSVNIAVNGYEYLVIALNEKPYKIVTYKEKSHNNIDIFSKRQMAVDGYGRKSH